MLCISTTHSGPLELPDINVTYHPASRPVDYPPAMADSKHCWELDPGRWYPRSYNKWWHWQQIELQQQNWVYSYELLSKAPSKSSYSFIPGGESNLPYTWFIGGSSGSISSVTTLTGKHRPETDDSYQFSFISSSSCTSYLNPLHLQEHTQSEAEKAGRGGSWKGHRHKHDENSTAKSQRDSAGQLPFLMGIDHSSSEDLADQEGYSRSRRYSDQAWRMGSSQEANPSLSSNSLNEGGSLQLSQTQGGSFHTDHHHSDSRPVMRSSRPGSKKKPDKLGISIDSGITSSDNSQENNIPTSTYIPGLETKPENGNTSINSRSRISNPFVPPTSQYGGYYDPHRYNSLSTPNPDSSSD